MENPEVEIGKTYVITSQIGGRNWKEGDRLEVVRCRLADDSFPEWVVMDKECKGRVTWCSGLYSYEETTSEESSTSHIIFNPQQLELSEVAAITYVKRVRKDIEYKGQYKLIIYFTNGKKFHVNNVSSYDYCDGKDTSWAQEEYFNYTMKSLSNNSFVKHETYEMDVELVAGFAVRDNRTGDWTIKPIKPCWHEKHSFSLGREDI